MLARALGRTVYELGQTMTADEFMDHYTDWLQNPWGDKRMDWQFALLRSTVINMSGKTVQKQVEPHELLMQFKDPNEPEQEVDPKEFFGKFGYG